MIRVGYSIDRAGLELIIGFEGFVNGVYDDSRGFATCGFGHLLHESPATEQDHREYDGRGRAFFEGLLHGDVERVAIAPMNQALHVPLNQHQVNAVASGCFNCGPGFVEGTVGREINAEHWQAAADAFLLWANPPVLRPRREEERALFLEPVQAAVRYPWLLPAEREHVEEYDRLHAGNKDRPRRVVLRRLMIREREAIKHAARKTGWEVEHRRQRYASLLART